MAVNVNTQKALGGNNPIKLSGQSGGDTNNSIAGWFEAPQETNPVSLSQFYRKTSTDLIKSDFQDNSNNTFVPDATENDTVQDVVGSPISFSDIRGDGGNGVIKEYVVTQTGNDVNLTLANANWNSNLGKNVPKVANINGRMTSGSAPSGQNYDGYNHKSGAALNFDAEAYNLNIDVDTGVGDNNNFTNATGVFGFGGQGGTVSQTNGNAGGTAMFVRQNSNRANALSNGSSIIKVNTNSGRLHGGGGGGEGGRNGNNGTGHACRFFSTANVGPFSVGSTIRSKVACNKAAGKCGNANVSGVIGYPNILAGGGWRNTPCNVAGKGRKRCRGNGRFRGNAGQMGCFKQAIKKCKYQHDYTGNTPTKGNGGGGGQGKGGTGPAGAGGGANNANVSNCHLGGNIVATGIPANPGTAGQAGGGYGQAGGNNNQRSGSGGAAGYALFTPTKSQVSLTNNSNNKGPVS